LSGILIPGTGTVLTQFQTDLEAVGRANKLIWLFAARSFPGSPVPMKGPASARGLAGGLGGLSLSIWRVPNEFSGLPLSANGVPGGLVGPARGLSGNVDKRLALSASGMAGERDKLPMSVARTLSGTSGLSVSTRPAPRCASGPSALTEGASWGVMALEGSPAFLG
jgi:hypothetical protein